MSEPYDLVVMDPPYAEPGIEETLVRLSASGLLKEQAVIVVEHSSRATMNERAGRLALTRTSRYGDTAVTFYRQSSGR